jgi:hypothetical protein
MGDSVANGKPHDHPLTEILDHDLEVYGPEEDSLVRRISELSSRRELHSWWETEIGWQPDSGRILFKARERLAALQKRASESGWETGE